MSILHPYQVPASIKHFGCVLWQEGPGENILKAGLKSCIFLTLSQLREIQTSLRYAMVRPGSGSGKRGRLIKRDWAIGLLNYFFPDQQSSQTYQAALRGLLGRGWRHIERRSPHSRDIVAAFHGLPKQDMREFERMIEADERFLNKTVSERNAKVLQQPPTSQQHYTPGTLMSLLPPSGDGKPFISRHPKLKRYQAFFTSGGLELKTYLHKLLVGKCCNVERADYSDIGSTD